MSANVYGCCSDKPPVQEGFPMKKWNIEIFLLDEHGAEKPATCFTKATYNLHPSFAQPVQGPFPPLELPLPVFSPPFWSKSTR